MALSTTSTTGPAIPASLATALTSAVTPRGDTRRRPRRHGELVFDLANSEVQYLAAGETVTAAYTITITDDSGAANAANTQDVTVVITGTNDADDRGGGCGWCGDRRCLRSHAQ